MNIQDLEEEMWKQVRNGRNEVYIKKQDLQELKGLIVDAEDDSRIFMNYNYVIQLIEKYKNRSFRENLKVNIKPNIVKNLTQNSNIDDKKEEKIKE